MTETQTSSGTSQRWLVLVGALMVQAILGTIYGFSALVKPLQAQFPGWSNQDIQMAFTLALLSFAITMVPAGRLQDRVGPRLPALAGAACLFVGIFLTSLVRDESQKGLLWLGYGVIAGAGIGLAYVCPIAALSKWFPDIKGLITGVAVAGFGGGAFIFIPTVSKYLNPEIGGHSLQQFFTTHALGGGLAVLVGGLLLCNPPAGWTPPKPAAVAARKPAAPPAADVTWQQMLRTPLFYLLWLMFMGNAMAGLMTIGVAKEAVKAVPGILEGQAALAGSILSLLNAFGRIFWGSVSDRLGRSRTMTLMFGLQLVVMLVINSVFGMGVAAAYVIMGLVGLNFGGNFALFPSATADAFGTRNLGVNYGLVFTSYGIGGVVGPQVGAYFKDILGVYGPAFYVAAALVGLACLLSLVYAKLAARPAAPEA